MRATQRSRSRGAGSASRLLRLDVLHGHRPFSDAARRGRRLRSRALGADRAGRRPRGRERRHRPGLRADARHRARSALGPDQSRGRARIPTSRALRHSRCAVPGRRPRRPDAVAATAKHFVAYGAATAGREYAAAEVSERALREIYLPPFAAAVAPGSGGHARLQRSRRRADDRHEAPLHDWLRGSRGFEGVLVSDYNAVTELLRHGVAADPAEAAALAHSAGVDIDMMGDDIEGSAAGAAEGRVAMAESTPACAAF